jgi:hypothetical protein
MRLTTPLLVLLTVGSASPAGAQSGLEPGTRIRVRHHCEVQDDAGSRRTRERCQEDKGTLLQVSDASLVLGVGKDATELSVPRHEITRLQVSRGRKGAGGRGAAIGALASLIVGPLVGLATCEAVEESTSSNTKCAVGGFLVVLVPGAALGLIIGQAIGVEDWRDVPLDNVAVGLAPAPGGGLGVRVSIGF